MRHDPTRKLTWACCFAPGQHFGGRSARGKSEIAPLPSRLRRDPGSQTLYAGNNQPSRCVAVARGPGVGARRRGTRLCTSGPESRQLRNRLGSIMGHFKAVTLCLLAKVLEFDFGSTSGWPWDVCTGRNTCSMPMSAGRPHCVVFTLPPRDRIENPRAQRKNFVS